MRLLVTGSTGMVGKNILEHPQIKKYQVLTPSRSEMNLQSETEVMEYLQAHRPEAIIHCAARVGGIQANIKHPVAFLIENLDISRNLILSAARLGIEKMINLGSSCMYPRNCEGLLSEDMILTGELEPTNEAYALAKITASRLCRYLNKENPKIQYKTLIPCNLYGRFDKFEPEHSHLVPAIIHKLHQAKVKGHDTVDIWGDGQARREFLDAADLADCVMFSLEKFDRLPEVVNVGLGRDYTVNEYYEVAREVVGFRGRFVHDLSKPVGMRRKLVSTERLDKLGWNAQTDLMTGLKRTYEFYKGLELANA